MSKKISTAEKKDKDGRYASQYRYSDKFISRMTGWLIACIFIGPGRAVVVGISGDAIFGNGLVPEWVTILAGSLAIAGIALPLLVGSWLGASAINRYAGPVGLLLFFGIAAVATGGPFGQPQWVTLGIGALIISLILFFYIGFQARVPIWLQLPILNSPRLYISHGEKKKPRTRTTKK